MDQKYDFLKQVGTSIAEQEAIKALANSKMDNNLKSLVAALITHSATTVNLDSNKQLTIDCSGKPQVMLNFKCNL